MKESAVVDQTLGEYLVQLLLTLNLSRQEASQIAAAWTGDQLSAYLEGENLLTAWITAWKKDEDARAFYRAYQNLLQRLHRLRFAASPGRTDSVQAELPGDRLILLQIEGPFVLLLGRHDADSIHATRRRSLEESGHGDRVHRDPFRLRQRTASVVF